MSVSLIHDSINRLQFIVTTVPAKLFAISEANFSAKLAPEKWSKKQIIGHLIDSAANNHQRFIRAQYEKTPAIQYDQNTWNQLNFYDISDKELVINLWLHYNQHLLSIIKHIPENQLHKQCDIGNGEQVTLAFLINDYVHHLEHHIKQVFEIT